MTLTIRPQRCAIIGLSARRTQRNGPVRFVASTSSQASSESIIKCASRAIAALLTSTSTPPRSFSSPKSATTACASRTSDRRTTCSPPTCASAAAADSASLSRAAHVTVTAAPARANASAIARPIPRVPPVTSARRPASARVEKTLAIASSAGGVTVSRVTRTRSAPRERDARGGEALRPRRRRDMRDCAESCSCRRVRLLLRDCAA